MSNQVEFLNWIEVLYLYGRDYTDLLDGEEFNQFLVGIEKKEYVWKLEDVVETYLDLDKAYRTYLFVFTHIPSNRLYGCEIDFVRGEGWEQTDLEWAEYTFTERTIRDYTRTTENAEKQVIYTANV